LLNISNGSEIDAIDRQLVDLLIRRSELVRRGFTDSDRQDVAGMMLGQSRRVARVVDAAEPVANGLSRDAVTAWLQHAASIGLAGLHRRRVVFLGPEYSYSHLAAIKLFGDAAPMAAVATIPAVFDSIIRDDAMAGLVPIENSTDGRIVDTLGMFVRVNVKICGEVLLPIHHNLLSRTARQQIREVHSKPQALSQCRTWLANHLPKAKLVECSSTTAAAELAASQPGIAAVASLEAGRQYQLDVIDASIEDNPNNVTRFAVLGRHLPPPTGNDKTAILFQVEHRPGALADAMVLFKDAGLNLTWIESFPIPQVSSEYLFFVETAGHASDPQVAAALERLKAISLRLEILGSYPRASLNPTA
jgi:chorismate mutase / prephenate dehydratase